jgi:hypothetical protein
MLKTTYAVKLNKENLTKVNNTKITKNQEVKLLNLSIDGAMC